MNAHTELLAKIIQFPQDNNLRLQFADLLIAEGNPHGQVIRWQCELETLTQADAGWYGRSYKLSNLLRGANPFISLQRGDSVEAQITTQLSAIKVGEDNVGTASIRRGFVEGYCVFDVPRLKTCESAVMQAAPLISDLEFSKLTTPGQFSDLMTLQLLAQATAITFKQCNFSQQDIKGLFDSPILAHVKQLTLYECTFSGGIDLLASTQVAQQLERLVITSTREEAKDLKTSSYLGDLLTGDNFPLLKSLELTLACTPSDLDRIRTWSGLPGLQQLELRGFEWPADMLAMVTQNDWRSLRTLSLAGLRGNPAQIDLTTCPALRVLILKGLSLDEACMHALRETAPPSLEQLTLSSCQLATPAVLTWLRGPGQANLKCLNFQDNQLDIECVRQLADTTWLSGLVALKLSFNPLGDECGSILASSPVLKQLVFLDLSETTVGDESAKILFRSPQIQSLQWLNLDTNSITAASLDDLLDPMNLTNIVALRLKGNELWDEHKSECIKRFGKEVVDSYWLGYLV